MIEELARALGKRVRFEWTSQAKLKARWLEAEAVSPLSGPWASFVDPSRAKEELGFRPSPWRAWLAETARWYAS